MPSHYEVVDGLVLPARLSGHPALDFCNTRAGWHERDRVKEYLGTYDHLAAWAGFGGLLADERVAELRPRGRRDRAAAEDVLRRAWAVRADLYRVLTRSADDGAAFARLSEQIRPATAALRLERPETGATSAGPNEGATWEIDPETGLEAPLLAALWSAAQLLASAALGQVEACPGHDCGWLFLNPSGRRRWCTMATCGNRAKVKRFADRQRGDGAGELSAEPTGAADHGR